MSASGKRKENPSRNRDYHYENDSECAKRKRVKIAHRSHKEDEKERRKLISFEFDRLKCYLKPTTKCIPRQDILEEVRDRIWEVKRNELVISLVKSGLVEKNIVELVQKIAIKREKKKKLDSLVKESEMTGLDDLLSSSQVSDLQHYTTTTNLDDIPSTTCGYIGQEEPEPSQHEHGVDYKQEEVYRHELYTYYNEEYSCDPRLGENKIPAEAQFEPHKELNILQNMQDLKDMQLLQHDIKPDLETVIYNPMSMIPVDHDNFSYYGQDSRITELTKLEPFQNNENSEFVPKETVESGPVNVDVVN